MSGFLGQALFGKNAKVWIFWSPDFKQTTVLIFVTALKTKAQFEEIKDNNSGLFEFPKLEWPNPITFIGYLSNFIHRVQSAMYHSFQQ